MKNLVDILNESLIAETLNTYDIDKSSEAELKKFANQIAEEIGDYEEEEILSALRHLIGKSLQLTVDDFSLETPKFDKYDAYLYCSPAKLYYSNSDDKWYNEKGK